MRGEGSYKGTNGVDDESMIGQVSLARYVTCDWPHLVMLKHQIPSTSMPVSIEFGPSPPVRSRRHFHPARPGLAGFEWQLEERRLRGG